MAERGNTKIPPPSEAWIQMYIGLNPGTGRKEALNEAALMASEATSQPPRGFLRTWLEEGLGPAGGLFQAARQPVVGGLDLLMRGGGFVPPNTLASGLSEFAVPQSPTELAVMAAAGPVSKIQAATRGVGPALAASAKRVGAMSGIGGGVAAATGDDPLGGAAKGAVSQGVGELVRGLLLAREATRHTQTYPKMLKSMDQDAGAVLPEIVKMNPEFGPLVGSARRGDTSANALMRIRQGGYQLAREMYQQSDNAVVKVLGGPKADIPLPSMRLGVAPPPLMKVEDALAELKSLRAAGRKAPPGNEGFAIRERARQLNQDILAALERRDPAARLAREDVDTRMGQAIRIVDALGDSGAFEGPVQRGTGAAFDGNLFLRYLQTHMEDLPYQRFKPVWDALLRGAHPGAAEVTGLAPRIRGYFGQGVSGTTPNIKFVREYRGGNESLNLNKPGAYGTVAASQLQGFVLE